MNLKRRMVLKEAPDRQGPVFYWMSREQRVRDNWPLLYAQQCAMERRRPLAVVFCLVPTFLHATRTIGNRQNGVLAFFRSRRCRPRQALQRYHPKS